MSHKIYIIFWFWYTSQNEKLLKCIALIKNVSYIEDLKFLKKLYSETLQAMFCHYVEYVEKTEYLLKS